MGPVWSKVKVIEIKSSRDSFLKVKVIEVRGQIYFIAAIILLLRRDGSNLCVFFFPVFSKVLGPIITKLGGKVEDGARY